MGKINTVQISGISYSIEDSEATKAVTGKQDTLISGTNIKTINNESILGSGNIDIQGGGSSYSAGTGIDITNDVISVTGKVDTSTYNTYTAATDTALASKQTTLTAGTNITIVDNVISATGGGSITIDPSLDSGSTNPVANSAITNAINAKADTTAVTQAISEATSGKADSSAVTESLATKVNVADNNVPAFSGVPLAINVNQSYASLQLKTIYIKNNDTTQHTNVVLGSFSYYNGSYNTSLIVSGSSTSLRGITAITNTDTSYYTFTLENGVCRIDFLGSCYFIDITLEGDGFSFYYIHNNNYTSGQSSTVIENTVYDALTELGKDIVDMNDSGRSGRFVNVTKAQDITGQKNFIGDKGIKFSQKTSSNKPGFVIYAVDTANTTTEAATFEFRPNTFTIDNVKHPLLYFGHYRTNAIANAGVPQTVIGFRQYDQKNAAAYHYLMPLPEKAKTPFNLTKSFKDYYAPMGFKNGSTMITADDTGVVDLSSEFSGKVDTSTYNTLSGTVTAHTADTTIHVTSTEKATWNAKSDFSGSYNDLTNKLSAGTNISIVDNVISAEGGGGKAISGGTNISITTGETADTINCTLPITAGTGTNSLILGYKNPSDSYWNSKASGEGAIASGVKCTASGQLCAAIGYENTASGGYGASNFAQGYMTTASGKRCHSEGLGTSSTADASHSEGYNTVASGNYSHSEGEEVKATNVAEHSQGRFNVSNKANTTWGDSGNTLFSVGNGTGNDARHNAFEIRQNGDIYLNDGSKLQDTVSATTANTTALGGLKLVKLTQAQYDALATKDSNTLYVING